MVTRSSLRASDLDRDRVAERLRQAATEGRLLAHELEERLARTLRAKTYGELDQVVADLPATSLAPRPQNTALSFAAGHKLLAAVALVGVLVSVAAIAAAAVAILAAGAWIPPLVLFLVFRARTGHRPIRR